MKSIQTIFLCFFLIFTSFSYAKSSEHLLWEKIPLNITLPLQKERLIEFPDTIKIVDETLSPNLKVLKVKNRLYLKAENAFNGNRLIVQILPEGEVIILNLSADEKCALDTPIEILLEAPKERSSREKESYEYNALQLTRFAIQTLYSPERLRDIPEGVYRTPMQTHRTVPLFYGASIEAHPIASWRGGNLYVTAIELKNLLSKSVEVNLSDLIGDFQTASFFPSHVLPPRERHESISIFLVSDKAFESALKEHARFQR